MRWINRLATAVTLLAFLIIPPAAFVVWAAARRWWLPTTAQTRAWLQDPLTEATVLTMILAVAALLWLLVVWLALRTVARRTTAALRRFRRMPLPTPAQATAGSMAGAALFGVPALGASAVEAGPPPATSTPHPRPELDATALHDTESPEPMRAGTRVGAGIELPDGGWIPDHAARTVAHLAGLIWLRRRQRYRPDNHALHQAHRDDPDLQPLPPTVNAVTAAYAAADPSAATASQDALLTPRDLPAGHLHLEGPGARDAVRGLLATALITAANDPTADIQVTTARADLTALLGDTATRLLAIPWIRLTDLDGDAMPSQAWHAGAGAGAGAGARPGPVLTIAHEPPTAGTDRSPTSPGQVVTTVSIGRGPSGTTIWHVAADGTVNVDQDAHSRPGRLCILSMRTAADLITLANLSRGTLPPNPMTADKPAPAVEDTRPAAHSDSRPGRLILLGGVRLTINSQTITVRRTAAIQILAFLAIHGEGATVEQLISAVWPGLRPRTITNRLYATISDLRRQLQPLLDDTPITRRENRYLLNTDVLDVDLDHLQAAIHAARRAITTAERHRAHHAAIQHYRGDLAAGHTWHWLDAPREQVRRDVIDAYTDLADTADPDTAVQLLRAAITVDPYNEHLHQRASQALKTAGHDEEASSLRGTYLRRLADAGLQPAPTAPNRPPAGRRPR